MERIINIDIVSENALFDKYNKVKVNKDLINYLLREIPYFTKADNFKIRINNCCSDIDSIPLIIDGLKQEYDEGNFRYDKTNFIQIIYFLLGVFILYLSTLINESVIKEIVLIGGWVFIWAIVESEISSELELRRKQKKLKKLLESEFIENLGNNYEDKKSKNK